MTIIRNEIGKIWLILAVTGLALFGQKADNKSVLANFDKLIESGKLTEIERDLFNYVIANPQDAAGFSLLAKLRLRQNRPNEAKALANKALSLDLKQISAKLILAQANFQMGEAVQTRETLNSISETEITDDNLRLSMAELYTAVGDCQSSAKLVEKLSLKAKNSAALPLRAKCLLQAGNGKSLAQLLPAAKTQTKQNPSIVVNFGEILFRGGFYRETADLMRQITVYSPNNYAALLLLAKSEIFLRDFADAKSHLAAAEKIQTVSAELYFVKSLLESEQGKDQAAYELLEKSLTLNSNDPVVLGQYTVIALRVGQATRALRAAEKLLFIEPENVEVLYLYGLSALQSNNLAKAEELLNKYSEVRPKDSRGCLALGLTLAGQSEKLEQSRRQMQKCLQIDPKNFEAAYQLGLSYKTAGETGKALEYFEQTVRISPSYAAALRDLGAIYLQTGAEGKARPFLEKAVLLNPKDADAHFQLSRLYNIINEKELARKHLEIFQNLKNPKQGGM